MEEKDLDLTVPADCRWYIDHFQREIFKNPIQFADLADGRRVYLSDMSDEDAVIIANCFYDWEVRAALGTSQEISKTFGLH